MADNLAYEPLSHGRKYDEYRATQGMAMSVTDEGAMTSTRSKGVTTRATMAVAVEGGMNV